MPLSSDARDGGREVALPFCWLYGVSADRPSIAPPVVPPPGCCHSLVSYQDRYLILFGGGSLAHFANDVFVYDMDSRRWSRKTPENSDMVPPRLAHSSVIHGDKMIVYGGQDLCSPVVYDDVLELDLATWRWSVLQHAQAGPGGPGARRLHNAHVVGNRMYVLMGTPAPPRETPLWYLDLHTNVWFHLQPTISHDSDTADEPAAMLSLCGCSSAASGDCIYLFGGYFAEDGERSSLSYREYVNSLFEYNTRLNMWRAVRLHPLAPCPAPRYAASLAVHANCLYLFGGDANQSDVSLYFSDLWRIRVQDDLATWRKVNVAGALRPSARSGCAYTCARASLFIVGGELPVSDVTIPWLYTADLFQLPLGYSGQLTLRVAVARWLGAAAGQFRELSSLPEKFPLTLGARCALDEYFGS
ncbi:putative Galactose oxidase, central domain/Kelch motif containing protein [Leishmania shawi]|uniref:Galactose oxidase, central domain/Kelch motif containing protein n=1 Tax=Leishmania shawi TaxID=5680 RepID=A0AAW3BVC1_9TRYP